MAGELEPAALRLIRILTNGVVVLGAVLVIVAILRRDVVLLLVAAGLVSAAPAVGR